MGQRNVGRPRASSPEQIRQVAWALFREHGFASTSLADIAAAAGIGRTALFGYVPVKSDLVWGPYDAVGDAFESALARSGDDADCVALIRLAFERSFADSAIDEGTFRELWALIEANPELTDGAARRVRRGADDIANAIARCMRCAPTDSVPSVAGAALAMAATEASRVWARSASTVPFAQAVDDALMVLLEAYRPLMAPADG